VVGFSFSPPRLDRPSGVFRIPEIKQQIYLLLDFRDENVNTTPPRILARKYFKNNYQNIRISDKKFLSLHSNQNINQWKLKRKTK
jgi:hypothetical protein